MKANIYESIEKLKKDFYNIQCRNWILSRGNGKGAAGRTLEWLLKKEVDNDSLPDYLGIELKTKYRNGEHPINLFSMAPDSVPLENKRLLNIGGYPDKKNPFLKRFYISVSSHRNFVGLIYSYQLSVDYEESKVRLNIYKNNQFLENKISWSFQELKSRFTHKITYLALIHVKGMNVDDKDYFKYEDLTFYQIKDFSVFIELIQAGYITITFKLNQYKDKDNVICVKDHGTSFSILEEDLSKLFTVLDRG